MKIKFLILLAFPLFFFACANDTQQSGGAEATHEEAHEGAHADEHESHDGAIELNNGHAWKVDDNMMSFIKKMDQDVAAFAGKNYNDYQILAMGLTENIDHLTSDCTMTGKAHDELHKWLLPYIEIVNNFAKAENEKDAQTEFEKVKASFLTFNQFFE